MNLKSKFRESFRPFAPSVLAEDVNDFFELNQESPYMLLVAQVQPARQLPMDKQLADNNTDNRLSIINRPRSDIPDVTHVDCSARSQTVHPEAKPDYYRIIKAFKELTGYAVIVNT